MTRKLGVCIPFANEKRQEKLINKAKENGFEIEFYNYRTLKAEQVDSCEVFFGNIKPEFLDKASNLKWFHCSMAGIDKYVKVQKLLDGEMILTNSSGAYGITISEHVLTVLLMLMRRMIEYGELQKERGWKVMGEVKSIINSTITVVGIGDLGENIAKRLKALGATIRGVRRDASKKSEYVDVMYSNDKLIDAIHGADAVILCLPQTPETKNIFSKDEFAAMDKESYLINVGRGSAVNEDELYKALTERTIDGAALDVFATEPLPTDNPLWKCDNLIVTPHVSGNTSLPLTCDILIDMFCENFDKYVKGEKLKYLVDVKKGY